MSRIAYPLGHFPFALGRASGSPPATAVAVPLATIMKWYWRVQKWQTIVTFSASASGRSNGQSTTIDVVNASLTSVNVASKNLSGVPGATVAAMDETDLLRGMDISVQTSSVPAFDSITGTPAGGAPSVTGSILTNLFGLFPTPSITYYPALGLYVPYFEFSANLTANLSSGQSIGLAFTNYSGIYSDTMFALAIDGVTINCPVSFSSAVGPVTGPSASATITPLSYWSYGGKYDTTTGA